MAFDAIRTEKQKKNRYLETYGIFCGNAVSGGWGRCQEKAKTQNEIGSPWPIVFGAPLCAPPVVSRRFCIRGDVGSLRVEAIFVFDCVCVASPASKPFFSTTGRQRRKYTRSKQKPWRDKYCRREVAGMKELKPSKKSETHLIATKSEKRFKGYFYLNNSIGYTNRNNNDEVARRQKRT